MDKFFDICIIGAGASGLAAALEASNENSEARILLLEKNNILGKKIRATGNGRCNISNTHAQKSEETLALLRKWGVVTRTYPTGLIYPYSESAADVTNLLTEQVENSSVEVWTGTTVTDIQRVTSKNDPLSDNNAESLEPSNGYIILGSRDSSEKSSAKIRIHASYVIVSTGGKSGPQYGTIGEGYKFLRNLGHKVKSTIPILAPIDCKGDSCSDISGIRAKGIVYLYRKSQEGWKTVFTEEGEIQFTSYGLSGICVFNMTRRMRYSKEEGMAVFRIGVDLCPDIDIEKLILEQQEIARAQGYALPLKFLLTSLFKEKLARYILRRVNIEETRTIVDITPSEVTALSECIHNLTFAPTGIHGWKEAQCTSGGVFLEELDSETGESRICSGLYVVGELQDYDGPCGGYNLNNAFLTGAAAGTDASRRVRESKH